MDKARRYCDQQERCVAEAERKFRNLGWDSGKIKDIIDQLIKEKSIDEQRFANSLASGKFRIKNWGKLKIMAALLQLKIPSAIINNALASIDEEEYRNTLTGVLKKKWELTSGETSSRLNKTASFAIGKGYESTLVFEVLKTINKQ